MILITGHLGYIGSVMSRILCEAGMRIAGLDTQYYRGCEFFPDNSFVSRQIVKDVRSVTEQDFKGIDAVVHLAALSNDPLGELSPSLTDDINHKASVRVAEMAKKAGVKRFLFSSSCSIYGIAPDDRPLTEEGKLNPITAYALSKADTERDVARLADKNFHPVFLRNATVYGVSPYLRLDLVVNNLVAYAYLTGKVAIMSDGTPYRPIIHVEDFCRAFYAVLQAPK